MQNNTKIDRRCQLTNTWLHIAFSEDISDELGNSIPYPNHHYLINNRLVYCWLISGWFDTAKSVIFLNDIIARFKITFIDCKYLKHSKDIQSSIKPYILKEFRGLKSKANAILKDRYSRVETRVDDYVFWCIKLYAEDLIKQDGLIIYHSLERWAFDNFIDKSKDKSTLRAKCRSTYNWYFDRDWKIGRASKIYKNMAEYQEKNMATRQEQAIKMHTKLAEDTRKKVLTCATGMFFNDYKKPNGSWNVSKIAKDTGTSRNSVMKYLKELL